MVHLRSVGTLLKAMELQVSAGIVEELESAISTKADISRLNTLFKKLQISTEEFISTDHRKACFDYVSRISRAAMKDNRDAVVALTNDPIFVEIQRERIEAFTVLTRISNILEHGARDPYEKILGLSFSYAHIVEGVFKRSVQDCYLIHELSEMKAVNVDEVQHWGVSQLRQEYEKNGKELTIFDGWDDIVRNAVAHARIRYDEKLEEMTFVDRTKKGTRSSTYGFEKLQQKYNELFDVYCLVLIRNQIWRVSDIIYAPRQRNRV
jgi:hypothetical protein